MSIALIENQPVYFVLDGTNPDDLPNNKGKFDFSIPVIRGKGDRSYCQIKIAPVSGTPNIITDSAFSSGSYWSTTGSGLINTGNATIGDGSTGSFYKGLGSDISVGEIYQLQINITDLFGTVYVYNGTTLIGTINSLGIQSISFEAESTSLFIKITDTESYVEVSNVDLFALPTDFAVAILNTSYVPVKILYYTVDTDNFTIKGDRLSFYFDWDEYDLQDACYYLAITDPEQNQCNQYGLYNPNFNLGDEADDVQEVLGWEASNTDSSFFPSVPRAEIESDNLEANYITNTRTKLCAGKTYTVNIRASTPSGTALLKVICGGVISPTQTVTTTPTVFTFTITTTTDDYLRIVCDNTAGGLKKTINVTGANVSLSESEWFFEYVTPDPYKYGAMSEIYFKLCGLFNNEDGLGFIFTEANFFPQVRCLSKFRNRKYYGERLQNENDIGKKTVSYAQRRKAKLFGIELQPNYLIDFLALAQDADHFYVDNTEWFVENDEPNVKFNDELDNFGDVDLELSNPTQLVRNVNSGVISAPPTDGVLADPSDETIVLSEPATGDTIKAK